jgi:cell wall-associated NlpC family hydrolase
MRAPIRHLAACTALVLVASLCLSTPVLSASARGDSIIDAEAQATKVADELVRLNSQLTELSGKVADAEHALTVANGRATAGEQALAKARGVLRTRHAALVQLAVQAFMGGGNDPGVLDDFDGRGASAPVRDGYVQTVGQHRAAIVHAATEAEHDVSKQADRLASARSRAAHLTDALHEAERATRGALAKEHQLEKLVDAHLLALIVAQSRAGGGLPDAATPAAAQASLKAAVMTHLPPAPDPAAQRAELAALSKVGSPYVWGGSGPDVFDCSGLTMWSWHQAGVGLTHWTGDQIHQGVPVPLDQLQPGDLIFMWPPGAHGGPPQHVAMYLGNQLIVQAPHAGGYVEVSSMWWWVGAARAAIRIQVPGAPPVKGAQPVKS